jgi:hypothetical protein
LSFRCRAHSSFVMFALRPLRERLFPPLGPCEPSPPTCDMSPPSPSSSLTGSSVCIGMLGAGPGACPRFGGPCGCDDGPASAICGKPCASGYWASADACGGGGGPGCAPGNGGCCCERFWSVAAASSMLPFSESCGRSECQYGDDDEGEVRLTLVSTPGICLINSMRWAWSMTGMAGTAPLGPAFGGI